MTKEQKDVTLLIMAAGIGSRFGGGIKQLEPVGLNDEIIMDYSIHDAIEAGFNKIVFVIRKDIEKDFKERIGNRVEKICKDKGIEVKYAFQDLTDIPDKFSVPKGRTKPWGTGQAVLSAKEYLNEPFTVINADDYYGKEAFVKLHDWLVLKHKDNEIALAGFILKNTLSDNGGVTRGVCQVKDNLVTEIVETSNIVKTMKDGVVGAEADGKVLNANSYVSMNFWGFLPSYLDVLEKDFKIFFETDVVKNPLKAEYLLPNHVGDLLKNQKYTVEVLETQDKWFGVTYKEDKEEVMNSFKSLIEQGVYSKELYSDLA